MRWAARLVELPNRESYRLSGGENTNAHLRSLKFTIIPKGNITEGTRNKLLELISKYKAIVKATGHP